MNKKMYSIISNSLILVLGIIGLVYSFIEFGVLAFQYYTVDSNIFLMVTSALHLFYSLKGKIPNYVRLLRYYSICAISVTLVVVLLILGPMTGSFAGYIWILINGSMLYQHTLCPIIAIVSFSLFEGNYKLVKKDSLKALIPTLIYAVVIIVLNLVYVVDGPYPFLKIYDQHFLLTILWGVIILGGAYGLALLCKFLNYKGNFEKK